MFLLKNLFSMKIILKVNSERIQKNALMPYIKQQPNKKIFGARFHLGLYNLSNLKKENWFHKWLREIGEEPVIFDQYCHCQVKGSD